ncbi:MAG: NAD(P)-binding domain-containing protein, partial [Planctomycetaceae bacterium]|nr:NAD(P)-binding domain-containing protein [Planctomycetaceae bacterium]
MIKIALIGAGGKMGCRISRNLLPLSEYQVSHVENSPAGRERLEALGVKTTVTADEAIPGADVVVLAIPDSIIKVVGREIVPLMRSGAICVSLAPAAAYACVLPERADIAYFVGHPCPPPR